MLKMLFNQGKSHLFCGLIGLLCGVLGFFLFTIPFNYFKLTVNPQLSFQIDPVNFLSLIVTVTLGIFVLRSLNRKDEGDKVERDLLITYFTKFESNFTGEIHSMTAKEGIEGSEVAIVFKKYGMYIQEILEIARGHKSKNEEKLIILEKSISEIRELLSNLPRTGEVEDGVRLEGTQIFYSSRHLSEVTVSMAKFRKAIFNVIANINRS